MIRAVIDVNVLLSSIIAPLGIPRQIGQAWEHGAFVALASNAMIQTLTRKLALPRISRKYNVWSEDRYWVYGLLMTQTELVTVLDDDIRDITDDPEDNHVLAAARLGKADYLVTGDKTHLLPLRVYEGIAIITPRELWDLLQRTTGHG